MKKLVSTIVITLLAMLTIWATVSTIEVISKNCEPNPQYSSTNLWVLLANID